MSQKIAAKSELDNFDELLGTGDISFVEQRFMELLPKAESLPDKSTYLQILSQLALTQAMQQKFAEAHKTLDLAESMLAPKYNPLKHVSCLKGEEFSIRHPCSVRRKNRKERKIYQKR